MFELRVLVVVIVDVCVFVCDAVLELCWCSSNLLAFV